MGHELLKAVRFFGPPGIYKRIVVFIKIITG